MGIPCHVPLSFVAEGGSEQRRAHRPTDGGLRALCDGGGNRFLNSPQVPEFVEKIFQARERGEGRGEGGGGRPDGGTATSQKKIAVEIEQGKGEQGTGAEVDEKLTARRGRKNVN